MKYKARSSVTGSTSVLGVCAIPILISIIIFVILEHVTKIGYKIGYTLVTVSNPRLFGGSIGPTSFVPV